MHLQLHGNRSLWAGLLISLLIIPLSCRAKADISGRVLSDVAVQVNITGEIRREDAVSFTKLARVLGGRPPWVWLDSTGGDLDAAMAIGRLIRQHGGHTRIPDQSKCYSSCALIFISGVVRNNHGELGLHRPYLAAEPGNTASVEKQVTALLSSLKRYISEMGVTDNFYQLMVNTEPSKMVIFNSEDYTRVVAEKDPVFDEVSIAHQAREYGIATDEMRRRQAEAEKCFSTHSKDTWDCQQATLWGLSVQAYRDRLPKTRECSLSDQEKVTVKMEAPSMQQAWEHPLILRRQACERNIMLER